MRKIPRPYDDPTPLFRHGGAVAAARGNLLDFSASINPLGPPESVLRALREALPDIAHYPDPECRQLTERLAGRYWVEPEEVVIGNGSNDLIYAIARAFHPRRVAIAEPTYTEYLRASQLVGAEVDHWLAEGEDFHFEPFDPEGADLVWLCNPNNPTGSLWPNPALKDWIAAYPQSLFVVDEAFSSSFDLWAFLDLPNLIVLQSFTKWFALAGLRLGCAIAHREMASRVREQLSPWSVNVLAQIAVRTAVDDREFEVQSTKWWLQVVRPGNGPTMSQRLAALSPRLRPLESMTHFVLMKLEGITAPWLIARLADKGILIRDASNFVGLDDRYVRVAVRTSEDNERLLTTLANILEG